jgi:hypothetical protein
MAPAFRDRRIMGTRFRCTTILPHGVACAGLPSIYIRKRGRGRWTMADHSRAIRARQAVAPIDAKLGTFASIVKRCEVAFLYDRSCVPSYTVARFPGCHRGAKGICAEVLRHAQCGHRRNKAAKTTEISATMQAPLIT